MSALSIKLTEISMDPISHHQFSTIMLGSVLLIPGQELNLTFLLKHNVICI